MTRALPLALVLLPVGLAAVGLRAWQAPSFRANADLVSIYATVTDRQRRLVPDLEQDDFEVYDNGKRQAVTFFSNEPQPFSVVMMLDRSGSMEGHFELVRRAGVTFVRQLTGGDRARIGTFSREIVIEPSAFTSDRDELARILRGDLQNLGPSPVWAAIDRSISAVASEPGRRVVLVFTDGHDDPVRGQPIVHFDDVLRRARANDVMIYAVGFAAERPSAMPRQWPPTNPVPWPGMPGRRGTPGRRGPIVPHVPGGRPLMDLAPAQQWPGRTTRVEPPDPGLKSLAEESGGGYFELDASDDLPATFARVAEELHRQYWLGFAPGTLDGRMHDLDVRVRRTDLHVRARKSYLAASPPGAPADR